MKTVSVGILTAVCLIACSERQIYDGIQDNRESRCYDLPSGPQRDSCLEQARGPEYDEYQRELKKLD